MADRVRRSLPGGFPDKEFQGRLVDIGRSWMNRAARHRRFEVSNRNEEPSIGMQANLRLEGALPFLCFSSPSGARQRRQEDRLRAAVRRRVRTPEVVLGDEYGGKVVIVSGVKPGERVTQGAYQLKPRVRTMQGRTLSLRYSHVEQDYSMVHQEPIVVLIAAGVLLIWGVVAVRAPVDVFPDLTARQSPF